MSAVALEARYDDRFWFNPPKVERPAIDDAQFVYDLQREVEASVVTNPVVMAHLLIELRDKIRDLETRSFAQAEKISELMEKLQ